MDGISSKTRPLRLNFDFKGKKGSGELINTNIGNFDTRRISSPIYDRIGSPLSINIGSPTVRSVASPTFRLTSPLLESTSIDEIIIQCRRLNSDFNSLSDPKNLILSASNTIRKAVDLIIDSQKKNWGLEIEKLTKKISDLTQQLDESNSKILMLNEHKKKFVLREERFTIDEMKLNAEKKAFENEKKHFSAMKKYYMQLEGEMKGLKQELGFLKEQDEFKEKRIHELFTLNIEKESELQELRNKEMSCDFIPLSELLYKNNSRKSSKDSRKSADLDLRENKLNEQLNELENQKAHVKEQIALTYEIKTKLQEEYKSFETSQKEISAMRTDMEIENAKLKDLRKCLDIEKDSLANGQKLLAQQKLDFIKLQENFENEKKDLLNKIEAFAIEKSQQPIQKLLNIRENSVESKEQTLIDLNSKDNPEEYFPQLKHIMEDLISEIYKKKQYIDDWFNLLYEREKNFNAKFDDFIIICSILENKVFDAETEISVDFQAMVMVVQDMIREMSLKKSVFDSNFKEMYLASSENFPNIYTSCSYQVFNDLLGKFQDKAQELQEIREDLEKYREKLNQQNEENSLIAQFLKEERINFESEKIKKEREYEVAKNNLIELHEKLDATIEQMNNKEKDLLALQDLYESRLLFSDDSVSII
ncbi:hypothetical protein SteCoe_38222 [Stentor coeruleus]|uniref:Uncharacterized protein n=1 Tax=Stentor coeruleus TaxID=5963 RepID=A0A1R2ALP4_9CILI|nr:hypothetical protein SteCoe_38222 [Stentor coeruleus]